MKVTTLISALTFLVATAQATAIPAEGEDHKLVTRQRGGWCPPGDIDCFCRQPPNRDSNDCICHNNPRDPRCRRQPPPPQWCRDGDWRCCRENPWARGCNNRGGCRGERGCCARNPRDPSCGWQPGPPNRPCNGERSCCARNPRDPTCGWRPGPPNRPCNGERSCCARNPRDPTCGWQPGRPGGH